MNARRNSFEKEEAFVVVVVVFVVVVSAVSPLAADDADDFFKPSSTALFASSSSFAATPSSSSLRAAAALIFFFPRALSLSSYVVLVKQRADFVTALFSFSFSFVTAFFFAREFKIIIIQTMGKKKKLAGAAKRKKKKEKEAAIAQAKADLERLKLGPTKLWTGLVTHHRDIFVSHVLSKLNKTDRYFFSKANTESLDLLEYAGFNVSKLGWSISECTSVSTLEWAWIDIKWGAKDKRGTVQDQAWFCAEVTDTNKLELLKWVREMKKCEWDKWTIIGAAWEGNLEMLKYCFANGCPYDEEESCPQAAGRGHLDCLRFLFDKVKPSRETEYDSAIAAVKEGRIDILKYIVEERKISDLRQSSCVLHSVWKAHLDCLKYMVEEAKVPLNDPQYIAVARYFERTECLHYLREKGCPEPTDEEYTDLANRYAAIEEHESSESEDN